MIETRRFLVDVLGTNLQGETLLVPDRIMTVEQVDGDILLALSVVQKIPLPGLLYFEEEDRPSQRIFYLRVRFYSHGVMRLLISLSPQDFVDESPMLAWDPEVQAQTWRLQQTASGWVAVSESGGLFQVDAAGGMPSFSPDGSAWLHLHAFDQFVHNLKDSFPLLARLRGDEILTTGFALSIAPGEHFCGTGERFTRPDLFGHRIDLLNFDAAGVNNARAYKNIPLMVSSHGYGIFVHSPAKMRLDIGAHSTRALQWLVEEESLDVFFIGGGSPAAVLETYRRLTGFPSMPPVWTFGVWMSRASYYSDAEVSQVARRLRAEGYPADVLHLDIGWFEKEWHCDWKFSRTNFPEPEDFFRRMDEQGFHVSLWQYPHIRPEIDLAVVALQGELVGRETPASHRHWLGYTIDLTKPEAVEWYQSLLENLFQMGASAIKADFGEEIDEGAEYTGMQGAKLHNLYALLYQRAIWEVTERFFGKGNAVIWARSAWAGSQRYPVHWGGDAASTYEGLSGTICGGLHFGLSGFAFWSHDVGGIHGIPDFMTSRPSDHLYVRWTQVGVFSSHMRYHGGTPREPWEYPAVAEIVRQWLRFRYALLPYIIDQAHDCCRTGLPLFRSLVFNWPDDPAVWSIADQYLFGDAFLVCPVLDPSGRRDVYLPNEKWVDFWSGEVLQGPRLIHNVELPLSRLPLYVRYGSRLVFAEPGENTCALEKARRVHLIFDTTYPGFEQTALREWINL